MISLGHDPDARPMPAFDVGLPYLSAPPLKDGLTIFAAEPNSERSADETKR